MRAASTILALLAGASVATLASAQEAPAVETPAPVEAQAPAATPPPAAPPVIYAVYDKVEVEDAENPGVWDPCTVTRAFTGAYEVSCNYTKSLRRDVHVRKPGGQASTQTAAPPVTGAPFKRGDIILASVMGLPDDWRLCVVERNQLATTRSYLLACAGSAYNVLPAWVRVDPAAPQ